MEEVFAAGCGDEALHEGDMVRAAVGKSELTGGGRLGDDGVLARVLLGEVRVVDPLSLDVFELALDRPGAPLDTAVWTLDGPLARNAADAGLPIKLIT